MIEFPPDTKIADLQDGIAHADLVQATNAIIDWYLEKVKDVPDSTVTFEPDDPDAHDKWAATEEEIHMPWTLGHVVVHVTASAEFASACGAALAKGGTTDGLERVEVHWTTIKTTQQVVERLEKSRTMQLAFLSAWPDPPDLDNLFTKYAKYWGKLNAVGMTLGGLKHATNHFYQVEDILRQAREASGYAGFTGGDDHASTGR